MGIIGPAKFTYTTKELPAEDVVKALQMVKETHGVKNGRRCHLCLIIDANNIGYRVKKVENIFQFAKCFAEKGVDIIITADGPTRHHSKRDSMNRETKRMCAHVKSDRLRAELAHCCQQELSPDNQEKIKDLGKEIQKSGNISSNTLPMDFAEILQSLVGNNPTSQSNHQNISFKQVSTQADHVMARVLTLGECDAVVSNDSECIGMSGPESIMVKGFKFNKYGISSIVLASGAGEVMKDLSTFLRRISLARPPMV
jgi:hypothetical protein